MRKKSFFLVVIGNLLLVFLTNVHLISAMIPKAASNSEPTINSKLVINETNGECGSFDSSYGGAESYILAPDWRQIEQETTFATTSDLGTCTVRPSDTQTCCEQLGLTFVDIFTEPYYREEVTNDQGEGGWRCSLTTTPDLMVNLQTQTCGQGVRWRMEKDLPPNGFAFSLVAAAECDFLDPNWQTLALVPTAETIIKTKTKECRVGAEDPEYFIPECCQQFGLTYIGHNQLTMIEASQAAKLQLTQDYFDDDDELPLTPWFWFDQNQWLFRTIVIVVTAIILVLALVIAFDHKVSNQGRGSSGRKPRRRLRRTKQ